MISIVFLCSGGGGNLRFVSEAIRLGMLPAQLRAVITDRECLANQFAREQGIYNAEVDFSEPGQQGLIRLLASVSADVIVTNVHRILLPEVVRAFPNRLLNLHYSLLPAFGGTIGVRPVREAINSGCTLAGVTAHLVDDGIDTGRPLVQAAIALVAQDSAETVMNAVFRAGCLALLDALLLHSGEPAGACRVHMIEGRTVMSNPGSNVDLSMVDDAAWHRISYYPSPA